MNCNNEYLGKYISLIHRQANVFFTKEFSKFGFGSGQYMFLIHLYKNDGISQEELSELVNIDKGTTAKAIRKLEELNLIIEFDERHHFTDEWLTYSESDIQKDKDYEKEGFQILRIKKLNWEQNQNGIINRFKEIINE